MLVNGVWRQSYDTRESRNSAFGAPTPLPEGQLEELISRLPTHLERTADDAVIPVGAEVRITAGAFSGRVGKVTSSRRGRVKVLLMMFGHLREQELYVVDVRVIN
jgi:transcription antitermination factor NusG